MEARTVHMETTTMDMEHLFLTVGLAALVLAAILCRRSTSPGARVSAAVARTKVTDRALARSMLVEHADAFSNRPVSPFPVEFVTGERVNLSHSISTVPHGSQWRALRRNLTAGIFHPSRLGVLAPLQRAAADGLVASLALSCRRSRPGGAAAAFVVVRDSLHTAVLTLLMHMVFGDGGGGVGARDVRAVQRVLRDFFDGMVDAHELAASRMARLLRWRRWQRLLGIRQRMATVLLPLIAERQRQKRSNNDGGGGGFRPYVDSLLDLRVPNYDDDAGGGVRRRALTDDEKVTLVWEFLDAGTETIVSCVEWTLAHLVNQPDVQEKLRREVDVQETDPERLGDTPYLRAVILESLRLHPPVPVIEREVVTGGAAGAAAIFGLPDFTEDDGGGSGVVRFTIVPGAIGRDGKAWTDPDEFRPERFLAGGEGEHVGPMPGPKDVRMLPFGAGTRHCPGMGIGMSHVRILLAALVCAFEWGAPAAGGAPVDLTEVDGFVKHMKTPLMAHIVPRT